MIMAVKTPRNPEYHWIKFSVRTSRQPTERWLKKNCTGQFRRSGVTPKVWVAQHEDAVLIQLAFA